MKILLWTKPPGNLLDEAISFVTHGAVCHAGFMRDNGRIVEAVPPHIRERELTEADRPFIRAFELHGMTAELDAAFEREFDRVLAAPPQYSGEDLFGFLFNARNTNEQRTFCSRFVMHTIMRVCPRELWPLVRCNVDGTDSDWVSPRDLMISPNLVDTDL